VEHGTLLICAVYCGVTADCRISEAVVAMQEEGKRVSVETLNTRSTSQLPRYGVETLRNKAPVDVSYWECSGQYKS
jgi:hypothetical protein